MSVSGVGIGYRPELSADLLLEPTLVDFLEITAEGCTDEARLREVESFARRYPIAVHGVKLSLGDASGLDEARLQKFASVARRLRAEVVSEHVAIVRGGSTEIGHLTPVPMTREQVSVIVRNVLHAKRRLPDVPLLLENIAWTFRWPDDEMSEGEFYSEIAERTGCPLLLDVGNLFGNAVNSGTDPAALLRQYPLERVAMLHVAGGVFEHGFYFDTHAHAVLSDVLGLLRTVMERVGDLPIVLERDADFPTLGELKHEVRRIRETRVGRQSADVRPLERGSGCVASAGDALGRAQARLAELLTAPEPPSTEACAPFDPSGIGRARQVLVRKRVDDALPLLVHLHMRSEVVRPHAYAIVAALPRPRARVAAHDAIHIASRLARDATLGWDASRDELVLRAKYHFTLPGAVPTPRTTPYVGSVASASGARMWVLKGLGPKALVRQKLVPR